MVLLLYALMSAQAFFTIISVYVNILQKKMIMILTIINSFVLFRQNCAYQGGEGDRRA